MSPLWLLPFLVWFLGTIVPVILLAEEDSRWTSNGDAKLIPLLPWWIHKAINVNLFGAIFLSLIGLVISPLLWIGEFIYWLCTVGRKNNNGR